ncbi:MAG: Asp-tRNA(Asn)/Glu-tRNA(Gln) amidotransferase subunit GatC [Leifsonia sp.]|uniref:Asp-tRNA(Asn)/Glu-tRNA(Gln) amidotransferase subunit GatC n=1 Tax=Leifsonia sp. TaxID=1870902 RepID=UPI003F7ECCFB
MPESNAVEISAEQVAYLANLARIDLSPEEIESLTSDLGQIVEAVAKVQEVAGPDVPATSHPLPLTNVFRPDEVRPSLTVEQALSGAPDREGDRFRVASILDEE